MSDPPNHDERIYYRHGLAVCRVVRERPPEWMSWDDRLEAWVAPGHRLPELRSWADDHGVPETGDGPEELPDTLFDSRTPRDYQRAALYRWGAADGRGTVVLPTGAGKSYVAVLAIHQVGRGACVLAPTRALVTQWFGQLVDAFGAERVGAFYGEEKRVRPITVTTYHSAFTLLERHGDDFGLLVLDEVHHLADTAEGEARAWHDALRVAPAARRLGLTATYPDGRDHELRRLVGPVVYRRRIGEMVDEALADFATERRFVSLTPTERAAYDRAETAYRDFVERAGYRDRFGEDSGAWWPVFMSETRRSPAARRAFRAFRERERIVSLARGKVTEAARLMRLFPAERVILFCGSSDAAERVSRRFAIPVIRASTPASERKSVLDGLDAGRLRAVASVQVLDEGWDVPSAKLGIVLGDSTRGSPRQHVQRLGRLLRRQGDRVASLYEIVVTDTYEFFASQKRRGGLRTAGERQLGLGL